MHNKNFGPLRTRRDYSLTCMQKRHCKKMLHQVGERGRAHNLLKAHDEHMPSPSDPAAECTASTCSAVEGLLQKQPKWWQFPKLAGNILFSQLHQRTPFCG